MTIKVTTAEAQLILADKFAQLTSELALDSTSNVTVEIIQPEQPQPYRNKIAAIRVLRDDWNNRHDHLGLAEAKRLVELVFTAAGIPV
ncbi:MAG TPA: hypothetical protein VNU68_34780 [Verrucomicrobiae bacterium]|nr:hypothetical protein [Verrucomicrobiae bacterium]